MKKFKGKLITLEGPEGSGKSTQITLLYEYLKKRIKKVICFREPGSTVLGERMRRILLKDKGLEICPLSEMLLYQASRAQFVREKLIPALKKGYLVLLDRFTDATMAYQGYGADIDLKLIKRINRAVTGGVEPDLTILLDIEVKKGLRRATEGGKKDRMEQKPIAFHKRVRKGYLKLADEKAKIKVIDGNNDIIGIQERIRKIVLDAVGKRVV